jgi:hypothetical protein
MLKVSVSDPDDWETYLVPRVPAIDKLDFLDGYLFRVMVTMLRSEGADTSGLYDFYKARIEQAKCALSHYDRMLVEYVSSRFDRTERCIVHAGTGLGTLPSALSVAGYKVVGIEQDARRFQAASRVRGALTEAWPDNADRYNLLSGQFPAVLDGTSWISARTVLIFTNCGSGWPEELTRQIIALLPACGDVLLDTRLFGKVRETAEERQALLDRLQRHGLFAVPIAQSPPDAFYCHLKLLSAVQ